MPGDQARILYDYFLNKLEKDYHAVQSQAKKEKRENPVRPGAFGQYMETEIVQDGPVTLVMESFVDEKARKKYENA